MPDSSMKVLLLAPQPCHIDRGTPIAVDLTLATLSEAGYEVDLVTFPGGETRRYRGLRTYRVGEWLSRRPARAGLSAKKLVLDLLMLGRAIRLAASNRYTLVHAVEESAFIALLLKLLFRVPYVSDMDSRMTTQLTDRFGCPEAHRSPVVAAGGPARALRARGCHHVRKPAPGRSKRARQRRFRR